MRRKDRAVSTDDAMSFLRDAEWGVLSLVADSSEPYGVPLNYCVVEGAVYFHCAREGRKLDCLTHDNRVSFCAVRSAEFIPDRFTSRYESVIITGQAVEVEGEEKRAGLVALVERYSPDYMEEGLELIDRMFDVTRVYKIVIESIAGKAANMD